MNKLPWLPSELPPGAKADRCPCCGRRAMVPWTLRRDAQRKIWRTWVCTDCQAIEERPEAE